MQLSTIIAKSIIIFKNLSSFIKVGQMVGGPLKVSNLMFAL